MGPPFIQVNGYTTVGDPITGPRDSYENSFDYSGSLNWVHGKHDVKFEADISIGRSMWFRIQDRTGLTTGSTRAHFSNSIQLPMPDNLARPAATL